MFGCRREAAAKHQNITSLSNRFRSALPRRRNFDFERPALDELGKATPASQDEGLGFKKMVG